MPPPLRPLLLVDLDRTLLGTTARLLERAGFAVTIAGTFEDGVTLLKGGRFMVVVTAHHLGAHNGLHLVMRGRMDRPDLVAVVTSPVADPMLDAEASAFGAVCVVAPWQNAAPMLRHIRSAGVQPA